MDLAWPASSARQSLGAHGACLKAAIPSGVPLGEGAEGDDNWVAPYQQAMEAAARRVRPARRRLTDDQAEQIVTDEFSSRGIDIAAPAATLIARNLLHPFWPLFHPLRARREGGTWGWRHEWD